MDGSLLPFIWFVLIFSHSEGRITYPGRNSKISVTTDETLNIPDSTKAFSNHQKVENKPVLTDFIFNENSDENSNDFRLEESTNFTNGNHARWLFGNLFRSECSSDGFTGVCTGQLRCHFNGGTVRNRCSFLQGVCCLSILQCGQQSSNEFIYWANYDMRQRYLGSSQGSFHGFGHTTPTCEFTVIKQSPGYCGIKLEPYIQPGFSPSWPAQPCVDATITVIGLSIPLELKLCSNRDGLNAKKFYLDTRDIRENSLKIVLSSQSRIPVEMKLTQIRCKNFKEENLVGEATGILGIIPNREPPVDRICGIRGVTIPSTETSQFRRSRSVVLGSTSEHNIKPVAINDLPEKNRNSVDNEIKNNFRANRSTLLLPTKIANGDPAEEFEFPWQVAMLTEDRVECGASIIGEFLLLTAAHCLYRYKDNLGALKFTLGEWNLTDRDSGSRNFSSNKVFIHPQYDPMTDENDIAIVKLTEKIRYSLQMLPICLPIKDETFASEMATVTGWGLDEITASDPILQKITEEIMENSDCQKLVDPQGQNIPDTVLCMRTQLGDSCTGDSGGPSVVESPKSSGRYIQVGVSSVGSISCINPAQPGIYTRVSKYHTWIRSFMK